MEKKGIKFINELEEAPENSIVIFSAHGVSPEVVQTAKDKNMRIGDALKVLSPLNVIPKIAIKYKK